MKRYTVWALVLGFGILFPPQPTSAQPPHTVPRIGLIRPGSPPDPQVEAFLQGLRDLGYIEGKNIVIEYRWAEGKPARIPDLTAEVARLGVDVIVTTAAPLALKQATSTIPIVVPVMSDPVGTGLVASLARPGGNLTGLALMSPELNDKRTELLKAAFPKVSRVAVLRDATSFPPGVPPTGEVARALGLHLQTLDMRDINDLEAALAAARRERAGALNFLPSGLFYAHRARIVEAVAKTRLPGMYDQRGYVAVGGLMSYGPNLLDVFRRAATYVDKILKGAKPGDLPVEQPTKFELVINLKAARALGLTIPQSVLNRADEVIQ